MEDDVKSGDDLLSTLVNWYEASEEATLTARQSAERDRDYYDNKQWTDEEVAELTKRGQPVITINRIKRKIDFLEGVEKQQRGDPRAFPRNPQDEDSAEAATDAIRFVCDNNDWPTIRSGAWNNMLIEGVGAAEVGIRRVGERFEVEIKRHAWDRTFSDPHSSEPDFSDARYVGVVLWKDYDEAVDLYGHAEALESTLAQGTTDDTYDDKPKFAVWADSKRKRVKIVLIYYRRGGDWHWCLFTKGGKLRGGKVPYLDDEDRTECPLIMISAYVDRDNNRYGVVREMVSPQDEINKRRSKALHLMTVNQVIAEEGAVEDEQKAKNELAKPDGMVMVQPGMRFEIQKNLDLATAQFQLLQEAKSEIDLMGPNASMAGKSDRGESGRAIIAQQQGGYIEMAPLTDRLNQFSKAVYRQVWNRIRQYWTEERWIRVTNDENRLRFVPLNKTEVDEYGQPTVRNDVGRMMVDIIVEDVPDTVTIQQEQFDQLAQMAGAGVPIPPDVLIEASSLRNKDQLLERMRGGEPDPMAEQHAQLDLAQKDADVKKTLADAAKSEATALEAAGRNPYL